jgi:hypothetical protein
MLNPTTYFTTRFLSAATLCCVIFTAAGCNPSKPDTTNFKTAINNYYSAHPSCVWSSSVKFPAQADASNDEQTKGFDALTDAGLLTRKAEEKKRFLIGSKQVTDYDVSDKGRTVWTPDQSQPGYGNFCYGHRDVTSIDNVTLGTNQSGVKTATVNYHYDLAPVPDWAKSQETQTAFPNVQTDLSAPKTATATLQQTQDSWQVISN